MFTIFCKGGFLFNTEFASLRARVDLIVYKGDSGIVIEMKYEKSSD